jgi:uncharacterized protein YdhG (YjbR/CyaY superfamily)
MSKNQTHFKDIDSYIQAQPIEVRERLEAIRQAIKATAPKAEEVISYNMPAFKFHGTLVYFAVFKHHIGFYPFTTAITEFQKEISSYKNAKGSVQFPLDKPVPITLIKKIIKFRVKENLEKFKLKHQQYIIRKSKSTNL